MKVNSKIITDLGRERVLCEMRINSLRFQVERRALRGMDTSDLERCVRHDEARLLDINELYQEACAQFHEQGDSQERPNT